jgi:glycerophosphoryl diester phosphodiesterase
VSPYRLGVRQAFVARARARGFGVSTWTVDRVTRMRRLLDYGIDLLITNRADVAVRVRAELAAGPAGEGARV